jgi:hypothetical protein
MSWRRCGLGGRRKRASSTDPRISGHLGFGLGGVGEVSRATSRWIGDKIKNDTMSSIGNATSTFWRLVSTHGSDDVAIFKSPWR